MKDIIAEYKKSKKRLLFLDYDGTLVPFSSIPMNAVPSDELLGILEKLDNNKDTRVIIISGRTNSDMDKLFAGLSITLIAEHGAMIKSDGGWHNAIEESFEWKKSVIPVLNELTRAIGGSYIEDKHFSLNWDFRSSNPGSGTLKSIELIKKLEDDGVLQLYDLKIHVGSKNVEILPKRIGKGYAVLDIINQDRYDFILSIGDETTDEEMFEVLKDNPDAYTIKVGGENTFAKYRLKGVAEVVLLLKKFLL